MIRRMLTALCALAVALALPAADAAPAKAAPKDPPVDTCYQCHEPIQKLHAGGKHGKVHCSSCHSALARHADDPGPATRPPTDTS